MILQYSLISTPIGNLIALSDKNALYYLQFADNITDLHVQSFIIKQKIKIEHAYNSLLLQTKVQLNEYFKGTRTLFTIPLQLIGTSFQITTWHQLQQIPYGTTHYYQQQAHALNKPTAYRAVAQANGANNLTIIIPCHRVINKNNTLGGYNSGRNRKQWLLNHEKHFAKNFAHP